MFDSEINTQSPITVYITCCPLAFDIWIVPKIPIEKKIVKILLRVLHILLLKGTVKFRKEVFTETLKRISFGTLQEHCQIMTHVKSTSPCGLILNLNYC